VPAASRRSWRVAWPRTRRPARVGGRCAHRAGRALYGAQHAATHPGAPAGAPSTRQRRTLAGAAVAVLALAGGALRGARGPPVRPGTPAPMRRRLVAVLPFEVAPAPGASRPTRPSPTAWATRSPASSPGSRACA
jgi:hypothetical protein